MSWTTGKKVFPPRFLPRQKVLKTIIHLYITEIDIDTARINIFILEYPAM